MSECDVCNRRAACVSGTVIRNLTNPNGVDEIDGPTVCCLCRGWLPGECDKCGEDTQVKTIDRGEAWRVAMACMWYVANRSADEFLSWLFQGEPRHAGDPYAREWEARWRSRNFGLIFGHLDYENQRRFIEEVLRAYEADSAQSFEASERRRERRSA